MTMTSVLPKLEDYGVVRADGMRTGAPFTILWESWKERKFSEMRWCGPGSLVLAMEVQLWPLKNLCLGETLE